MKPYDYWLFDWDGCLAQTLEVWLKSYRQGLNEFGVQPADREIAHHFGDWQGAAAMGVEPALNNACMAKIFELGKAKLGVVDLYPGAKDLLKKLQHSQRKVAILSATKREVLEAALDHNGIRDMVNVVLAAEDVVNVKPHPEIIEKGLSALNGRAELAVMIGDSRKDLGAATNAGVDSILMFPPEHTIFYELETLTSYHPTYIMSGFDELAGQISD